MKYLMQYAGAWSGDIELLDGRDQRVAFIDWTWLKKRPVITVGDREFRTDFRGWTGGTMIMSSGADRYVAKRSGWSRSYEIRHPNGSGHFGAKGVFSRDYEYRGVRTTMDVDARGWTGRKIVIDVKGQRDLALVAFCAWIVGTIRANQAAAAT